MKALVIERHDQQKSLTLTKTGKNYTLMNTRKENSTLWACETKRKRNNVVDPDENSMTL